MAELLLRGFAPIATVLSFIAEERSAGIDQATSGMLSHEIQTQFLNLDDHLSLVTTFVALTRARPILTRCLTCYLTSAREKLAWRES